VVSQAQRGDAIAEQLAQPWSATPLDRGSRASRGWHIPRRQAKDVAYGARGRPVRHSDRAAGPANAQQLIGGALLIGREHRPEAGEHNIERAILEREVLSVALNPLDLQALGLRTLLCARQERSNEVTAGRRCAPARRSQRRVPSTTRNIQHALTGPHIDLLAQQLADDQLLDAELVKITSLPSLLLRATSLSWGAHLATVLDTQDALATCALNPRR
jgi:hypothetical protein